MQILLSDRFHSLHWTCLPTRHLRPSAPFPQCPAQLSSIACLRDQACFGLSMLGYPFSSLYFQTVYSGSIAPHAVLNSPLNSCSSSSLIPYTLTTCRLSRRPLLITTLRAHTPRKSTPIDFFPFDPLHRCYTLRGRPVACLLQWSDSCSVLAHLPPPWRGLYVMVCAAN